MEFKFENANGQLMDLAGEGFSNFKSEIRFFLARPFFLELKKNGAVPEPGPPGTPGPPHAPAEARRGTPGSPRHRRTNLTSPEGGVRKS